MTKTAIVCTGAEPRHLFPTFIIGSAAAAMGDEVILFFTPAAAPALVRGKLETVEGKGMPEMGELVCSLQELGGRILVCDLCLEATDCFGEIHELNHGLLPLPRPCWLPYCYRCSHSYFAG